MLHESLKNHLERLQILISGISGAYIERYEQTIFQGIRASISIRLRFTNAFMVEINEAVKVRGDESADVEWLDYRYHFQSNTNDLILRYDSTRHFPSLPHFPHHVHKGPNVSGCPKPDLKEVLEEIGTILGGLGASTHEDLSQ